MPPPRRATQADLAEIEALQHAAYARNRAILGAEPLPLLADYRDVLRDQEIWLVEADEARPTRLEGVLVLQARADNLLVWSVAIAPFAQGCGIGNRLLAFAEARARDLGLGRLMLYTGEKLTNNIAWYERHGYAVTHREIMPDRVVVHLAKTLGEG
jgi:GNAT superfamily N-acetyltransferase